MTERGRVKFCVCVVCVCVCLGGELIEKEGDIRVRAGLRKLITWRHSPTFNNSFRVR